MSLHEIEEAILKLPTDEQAYLWQKLSDLFSGPEPLAPEIIAAIAEGEADVAAGRVLPREESRQHIQNFMASHWAKLEKANF